VPFKLYHLEVELILAGLNKIRTSPDHGTAFDIAGKIGRFQLI
jgi:4-hydroxy-L-threonine phosphate dehydrogenase PdxA